MRRSPEEKLMIGVLSQMIQDYMAAREITDFSFRRLIRKTRKSRARMSFIKNYRIMQAQKFIETAKSQEFGHVELQQFFKILASLSRLKYTIGIRTRKLKMLSIGLNAYHYIFIDNWESDNYIFGFNFICRYIGLDPKRMRDKVREIKQEQIKGIRKIATKRGKKP